ncbi:LysR family transcriptional regulator [Metapseudomonas furukawaii]|uniref:Transcriptional regulator n=1 Tax=Metapseudomonas furukawaii TaxID=1149133 RepID=A0AAD1FG08_METFU|nr:LysR family transcriptional regulator [Pseudomonas furukawaii]ELS25833.1 Transcriptional regulator, LysR family [Pseudomonas furukawaii]BAU74652.1 transcriptional regulator [Pseudomonas furukawaii]
MAFDRLEAMRAFCRIVELGSFTRAADALGLAKTTVSGQILGLESLLGVKLLHRTTRRVTPTTDGAAYYERARALLDDIDELEAAVAQNRTVARGRVRVEMPSPVGICLVIPALPDFAARHPEVRLDIGCSERVVDLVQEGVDCALRGGPVTDPDLVCRPVGLMRFCLCAAPSYLRDSAPLLTPDDLPQQRFLGFTFPGGKPMTPSLECGERRYSIDQTPVMRFNHGGSYLTAALAGLGVVCVPRAEARPHLDTGALVELLPDWTPGSMPISLVYPQTRHLSPRVRAFADWAAALMAGDPLWRLPAA